MQAFKAGPREMLASAWRNRQLIKSLAQREVVGRYQGSMMGLLWSFLNPVFMLAVYTFVFSVVFKARWNAASDSKTEFALVLFAGLLIFNVFSDCIGRAPGLILANANYVKKVVFPLEVLPWVSLCAALFHAAISFGVWLFFYLVFFGYPPITILLLPVVVLPLALFTIGLSWGLASMGVYLRDVGQLIGIFITVLMFMSPIFYPLSAIPDKYQFLIHFNPLAVLIEYARDVLIWGKVPNLGSLAVFTALSIGVALLGFAWFQKTRKGFADVL
jgi:lipopolysaccharide transport system permease protein